MQDEDGYQSWAQQVARNFSAETMVEAISGYGVTTNSTPIQRVLDNTNSFIDSVPWDYSSWIPHAVILLIGPNDRPGDGFIQGYLGKQTEKRRQISLLILTFYYSIYIHIQIYSLG